MNDASNGAASKAPNCLKKGRATLDGWVENLRSLVLGIVDQRRRNVDYCYDLLALDLECRFVLLRRNDAGN
jgi:hypothetical protein